MNISNDLQSIRVDKGEPEKLCGINASELHKAKEHVQLKIDTNLNHLRSVINE
jgi:hypothetical protein